MNNKNLYLIRHGEILRDGSSDDYFYRLTDIGNKNAYAASKFIKENYFDPDLKNEILTSNTLRTLETAMYLSKAINTKLTVVNNCHELDMGFNECKDKSEWKYVDANSEFTDRANMSDEERFLIRHYLGESPEQVLNRLIELEEKIYSSNSDNLYIVGHGTTLRLLVLKLIREQISWFYQEPIPTNCSVRKLVLVNNKVVSNEYVRS